MPLLSVGLRGSGLDRGARHLYFANHRFASFVVGSPPATKRSRGRVFYEVSGVMTRTTAAQAWSRELCGCRGLPWKDGKVTVTGLLHLDAGAWHCGVSTALAFRLWRSICKSNCGTSASASPGCKRGPPCARATKRPNTARSYIGMPADWNHPSRRAPASNKLIDRGRGLPWLGL